MTSGDFRADTLSLKGNLEINSTSGDSNLTDGMEQYTIAVDTVSGSCNLPNSYTGGTKKISVDTGSGNIVFRFEE